MAAAKSPTDQRQRKQAFAYAGVRKIEVLEGHWLVASRKPKSEVPKVPQSLEPAVHWASNCECLAGLVAIDAWAVVVAAASADYSCIAVGFADTRVDCAGWPPDVVGMWQDELPVQEEP